MLSPTLPSAAPRTGPCLPSACLFTLLWARIAAVFANKADAKTLNRATGIVLVVLGIVVMGFNLLTK